MVVRFLTRKVIPVATLGVAVTVYSSPALAFFPPVPIGSQEVVTVPPVSPIIVSPPVVPPPPVVVPPVSPPPFVPPPVVVSPPPSVPVVPVEHCPMPQEVPEPGTMALAAVGLGGLAAAALRKKFGKKKDAAK